MEVRAQIKYVRISPIKLRTLIDSIKVMSPQVALDHLGLSQNRTAKVLYKAIHSAVANGSSVPGFDAQKATFKTLAVDEGPYLRRYRAGSRGTAKPFVRKSSHITVVLEQKGVENVAKDVKVKATEKPNQSTDKPAAKEVKETKQTKAAKVQKPKAVKKTVTSKNTPRTTNK